MDEVTDTWSRIIIDIKRKYYSFIFLTHLWSDLIFITSSFIINSDGCTSSLESKSIILIFYISRQSDITL